MFIDKSNYNYIISCVIKEKYRYKNYGKLLMETLLEDLNDSYACCLTVSKGGYGLAKKYMQEIIKLSDDITVFEAKN